MLGNCPFEQGVPEITTLGSSLKGDYFKNSPSPFPDEISILHPRFIHGTS